MSDGWEGLWKLQRELSEENRARARHYRRWAWFWFWAFCFAVWARHEQR